MLCIDGTKSIKHLDMGNGMAPSKKNSHYVNLAFPWFRRLVKGLSQIGLTLDSRPVHLLFVLDKTIYEEILLSAL